MFKMWMKKGFGVVAVAAFLFAFLPAGLAFAQGPTYENINNNTPNTSIKSNANSNAISNKDKDDIANTNSSSNNNTNNNKDKDDKANTNSSSNINLNSNKDKDDMANTNSSSNSNANSHKDKDDMANTNKAVVKSILDHDKDVNGQSRRLDSDWRLDSTQSANWSNSMTTSFTNLSNRLSAAQARGINISSAEAALTNYQNAFMAFQANNFQKSQMHSKAYQQAAATLHKAYNQFERQFRNLHLNDKDYIPGVNR